MLTEPERTKCFKKLSHFFRMWCLSAGLPIGLLQNGLMGKKKTTQQEEEM